MFNYESTQAANDPQGGLRWKETGSNLHWTERVTFTRQPMSKSPKGQSGEREAIFQVQQEGLIRSE